MIGYIPKLRSSIAINAIKRNIGSSQRHSDVTTISSSLFKSSYPSFNSMQLCMYNINTHRLMSTKKGSNKLYSKMENVDNIPPLIGERGELGGGELGGEELGTEGLGTEGLGTVHAPPTHPITSIKDISSMVKTSIAKAFPDLNQTIEPRITQATNTNFGDYQCNAAMAMTKQLNMKPRDIASQIIENLPNKITEIMEPPSVAGPGFINLRFKSSYLSSAVRSMSLDPVRCSVPLTPSPNRIVVDYSSPNIAKEMHVGHLRSTIIGHTVANLLAFQGHDVVRLNHVGDWGTQFGMLVEHLKDTKPEVVEDGGDVDVGELVVVYKQAKKRFDVDDEFKTRAREGVVKLQGGDEESIKVWKKLCEKSSEEVRGRTIGKGGYSRLRRSPKYRLTRCSNLPGCHSTERSTQRLE